MSHSTKAVLLTVVAVGILSFLLFLVGSSPRQSVHSTVDPLLFYCAAGIKPPVEQTAHLYSDQYQQSIDLQYGGSGTLLGNIQITEQGDLYLAADVSYLEIAREKGLVKEIIPLAIMKPVLAFPKREPQRH